MYGSLLADSVTAIILHSYYRSVAEKGKKDWSPKTMKTICNVHAPNGETKSHIRQLIHSHMVLRWADNSGVEALCIIIWSSQFHRFDDHKW